MPELVKELLAGNIYINVHTAANQPGEVRGQVGERGFLATLDTAQAVPTITTPSSGSGTASFRLNAAGTELKFDVTLCDLTGAIAAAHFHNAAAGSAGPVVRTISADFDGNTASGVWTSTDSEPLTEALINDLLAGNLYLNVHTAANQPEEIRGQVNPATLVTSVDLLDRADVPRNFTLQQNFPNPDPPS